MVADYFGRGVFNKVENELSLEQSVIATKNTRVLVRLVQVKSV